MNANKVLVALAFLLLVLPEHSKACSAFLFSNSHSKLVAKNFDWGFGHGLVMVNKRNLLKKAAAGNASWTSKYGSITFNQVSRELPQGGMNEKGLVVEALFDGAATYPDASGDSRPSINELQWAQYQLDNFSTTDEVLAHAQELRIAKIANPVHYFICDANSKCATFDPLRKSYDIHSGDSLKFPVFTNSSYLASVEYASEYIEASACSLVPSDYNSVARYARLACYLRNGISSASPNVDFAFQGLAQVAGVGGSGGAGSDDSTRWSIVYDLIHRQITFKTDQSPQQKFFSIDGFNYSCTQPTMIFDPNTLTSGNVQTLFSPYTDAAEQQIVSLSWNGFIDPTGVGGASAISRVVQFARSSTCQEK